MSRWFNSPFAMKTLARLPQLAWLTDAVTARYQRLLQDYQHVHFEHTRLNPSSLTNFERTIYSQNGEDGIIEEIFRRIGITNAFLVEFGVEDGVQNNTRHLLEHHRFRGVWIEADPAMAVKAQELTHGHPVTVVNEFVTSHNILELFQMNSVPPELDLLSIDIDGNDYWVLQQIMRAFRPRVIVAEYNAFFTPGHRWSMPERSSHRWNGTNDFGASLDSLGDLLESAGYTLVGCDSQGVNAFFVRSDQLSDRFLDGGNRSKLYRAPRYSAPWFGHPPRLPSIAQATEEAPATPGMNGGHLYAEWATPPQRVVRPSTHYLEAVRITNTSTHILKSVSASRPPWISYYWLDAAGSKFLEHGHTTYVAPALTPNHTEWYAVTVIAPWVAGQFTLVIELICSTELRVPLLRANVEVSGFAGPER